MPHRVSQKMVANSTAKGDRPVLLPYSSGSPTLTVIRSSTTNSAIVSSGISQPGSTAKARMVGSSAAATVPTSGMKRSTADSRPHSMGLGTPMTQRPMPKAAP